MNTKPMLTAVAAALFSLGACVSAQAADLSTCTTCHSNITKAHAGAAHAEPAVLYVVSWDRVRCQWSATATEARPGSFESKLAFPPAWRGLRNDELVAATGIPNCVFVHASGFLACNTDRDDLLAMIDRSIEMQPERYQLYKNVP